MSATRLSWRSTVSAACLLGSGPPWVRRLLSALMTSDFCACSVVCTS